MQPCEGNGEQPPEGSEENPVTAGSQGGAGHSQCAVGGSRDEKMKTEESPLGVAVKDQGGNAQQASAGKEAMTF